MNKSKLDYGVISHENVGSKEMIKLRSEIIDQVETERAKGVDEMKVNDFCLHSGPTSMDQPLAKKSPLTFDEEAWMILTKPTTKSI